MARSAAEYAALGPVSDHFRHRGVLVGKPVRRILEIVNLVLGVGLITPRHVERAVSFIQYGLDFIAYRKRPWNIGKLPFLGGLSSTGDDWKECKHQAANKNFC